jgi:hypothetical protein
MLGCVFGYLCMDHLQMEDGGGRSISIVTAVGSAIFVIGVVALEIFILILIQSTMSHHHV